MLQRFGKLLFIDLETTGPNPATDAITEIGIVEVSAAGVKRWSTLVNPQMEIPPFIRRLTNISDEMVRDAPTFEMLHEEVQERLRDGLFIAHNARFDYGFLRNAYKRLGIALRCEVLCTVKLSRKLFPSEFRHSLDALVARHALNVDTRHRALPDADLLWQFWRKLEAAVPAEKLHEAVDLLLQRPAIPTALEQEQLDDLPDEPGVYVFYGEHDVPLHVGKGAHLRQRVLAHFPTGKASYKDAHLARQVRRLEWRETIGEIGAHLMQIQLTRTLHPVHDAAARQEREVCAWQLRHTPANPLPPVLVGSGDIDFGSTDRLYGLFGSHDKAETALRSLTDKFGLAGLERQERLVRLEEALSGQKLQRWPYAGPVAMVETGSDGRQDLHLVDNWCYLGSAQSEQEMQRVLQETQGRCAFDAEVYKVLQRALADGKLRVRPLAAPDATRRTGA
jgi:DNA polymerase III subunit epsilon